MADTQYAGSGTLLLILVQVASRGLTFIGNQFLLRFLAPSLLGIAVQLELVSVTSLYFARESLRVALQRQPPSSAPGKESASATGEQGTARQRETQTVVNLSYLAVLLGFGISTLFGYSYLQGAADEALHSPYFNISFQIYAAATIMELLAEPAFVVIQQRGLFKDRARAETSAAMTRCFAACAVAVLGYRRGVAPSILPFAAGQAAYAVTLLGLYLLPVLQLSKVENFYLIPTPLSLLPSPVSTTSAPSSSSHYHSNLFHKEILSVATTMYMQSVFKLLLTQGDALIMSFLSSLADQGAFALASNYGGLLARLVLQPVEESSRNTFGRLLAPGAATVDIDNTNGEVASTSNTAGNGHQGGTRPPESPKASRTDTNTRAALRHLSTTLRLYLLFARPLVTLVPSILPTVVPFFLSFQWRTPATIALLQTYCYYIPLMAVNGILDAFVTSVATPAQLRTQSLWMVAFTGVYAAAAWAMMDVWQMGSVGLVGANMVNMALRIAWSLRFVRAWARERGKETGQKGGLWSGMLVEVMPNAGGVLAWVVVTNAVTSSSSRSDFMTTVRDADTGELNGRGLGLWVAGAVVLVATMLYTDGIFLSGLLESILPKRLAAKIPAFLKQRLPAQSKAKTT
ncbi:hypothetical protein PV04_01180 [Phialophora macrospora]|uniref:Man(5)GlcNAc(2)-PP-dolichol translocation protein RFT1 n=1 Tax=Phialophora macrospora TaxID=1851006 RepID=A0A0D2D671_9EURO|nr:hypothetical protein PV04_01180 [Phialophora macrospora]